MRSVTSLVDLVTKSNENELLELNITYHRNMIDLDI